MDFAISDVSPSLRKRSRSSENGFDSFVCRRQYKQRCIVCWTRTIHADNKISTKVNFCPCVVSDDFLNGTRERTRIARAAYSPAGKGFRMLTRSIGKHTARSVRNFLPFQRNKFSRKCNYTLVKNKKRP